MPQSWGVRVRPEKHNESAVQWCGSKQNNIYSCAPFIPCQQPSVAGLHTMTCFVCIGVPSSPASCPYETRELVIGFAPLHFVLNRFAPSSFPWNITSVNSDGVVTVSLSIMVRTMCHSMWRAYFLPMKTWNKNALMINKGTTPQHNYKRHSIARLRKWDTVAGRSV